MKKPRIFKYYYAWLNNPQLGLRPCPKRAGLIYRPCRVVARAPKFNSVCIEFKSGGREIVSRHALRLIK